MDSDENTRLDYFVVAMDSGKIVGISGGMTRNYCLSPKNLGRNKLDEQASIYDFIKESKDGKFFRRIE